MRAIRHAAPTLKQPACGPTELRLVGDPGRFEGLGAVEVDPLPHDEPIADLDHAAELAHISMRSCASRASMKWRTISTFSCDIV
jgi:hypothetical protein